MRISALIARLSEIHAQHGDLIVMHTEEDEPYLVEQVDVNSGEPISANDPWHDPPHVLLSGPHHIDSDGRGGLRTGGEA